MRRDIASGKLPSVQIASSIIAGFQTQEAVKIIQKQESAPHCMIQYNSRGATTYLDVVKLARRPNCPCNFADSSPKIIELPLSANANSLADLKEEMGQRGYDATEVVFPEGLVIKRVCQACGNHEAVFRPPFMLNEKDLACTSCGSNAELVKADTSNCAALEDTSERLVAMKSIADMPLSQLGFPPLAFVHVISSADGNSYVVELSADAHVTMGGTQFSNVCNL